MAKEEFKLFVKKNPRLLRYINDGSMTWQKFYEMFDMFGENNDVWKKYLEDSVIASVGITDILNYFKNINLDNVQEGINSIQRVLGVLGDITGNKDVNTNNYEPKPIYKHFDD